MVSSPATDMPADTGNISRSRSLPAAGPCVDPRSVGYPLIGTSGRARFAWQRPPARGREYAGAEDERRRLQDRCPAPQFQHRRVFGRSGDHRAGGRRLRQRRRPTRRVRSARPRRGRTGTAPACLPATLDHSATLAGTSVDVSPAPGTGTANPRTQISFRGVPVTEIHGVSVVGRRSGRHAGRLQAYSQGDGGSFVASTPFDPGEQVDVRAVIGARQIDYRFPRRHPVLDGGRAAVREPGGRARRLPELRHPARRPGAAAHRHRRGSRSRGRRHLPDQRAGRGSLRRR